MIFPPARALLFYLSVEGWVTFAVCELLSHQFCCLRAKEGLGVDKYLATMAVVNQVRSIGRVKKFERGCSGNITS